MTINYATHNQQQGQGSAEATQGSRYEHLRGSVRRAPAETAGKGGNERRGTCRLERCASTDPLRLGKSPACTVNRPTPSTCQSTRSQSPNTLTRSLKKAFWAFAQYPLLTIRQLPNIMSRITSGQSILPTSDSSPLLPPRRDNRRQDGLVSH